MKNCTDDHIMSNSVLTNLKPKQLKFSENSGIMSTTGNNLTLMSGSHSSCSSGYGGSSGRHSPSSLSGSNSSCGSNCNKKKVNQTDENCSLGHIYEKLYRESEGENRALEKLIGNGDTNKTESTAPNLDVTSVKNDAKCESPPLPPLLETPKEILDVVNDNLKQQDGFTCLVSMHDGIVMYTTPSFDSILGFPKGMWIGKSFIDCIYSEDSNIFVSKIMSGLAASKQVISSCNKGQMENIGYTFSMHCRIRHYRGLSSGFSMKHSVIKYVSVLLKSFFKNVVDKDESDIYLVVHAIPFCSAFKIPNEKVLTSGTFELRHVTDGTLVYVDPKSIPYLGYLPQDIINKNVFAFYHPDDLNYLKEVYETVIKHGSMKRSKPYRFQAHNGHYVQLETEWVSLINPWTRRLEFITAIHHVKEGPVSPDVFKTPVCKQIMSGEDESRTQLLKDNIVKTMNKVMTKPASLSNRVMEHRYEKLGTVMETLMEDIPKFDQQMNVDQSCYERQPIMYRPTSFNSDYTHSIGSRLSYSQLSYNETLKRYFSSYRRFVNSGEYIHESNEISRMRSLQESSSHSSSDKLSSLAVSTSTDSGESEKFHQTRLTQTMITKHNTKMETYLAKKYNKNKGETQTLSNEIKPKQKEYLPRYNDKFKATNSGQFTSIKQSSPDKQYSQGAKRVNEDEEVSGKRKLHKVSSPQLFTPVICPNFSSGFEFPEHLSTVPGMSKSFTEPVLGSSFMYTPATPSPTMNLTNKKERSSAHSGDRISATDLCDISSSSDSHNQNIGKVSSGEESKTDGDSSYSSLYFSVVKSDTSSGQMSCDLKIETEQPNTSALDNSENKAGADSRYNTLYSPLVTINTENAENCYVKIPDDQICLTSDLIYRYQIEPKEMEDILSADKQQILQLEQSSVVNEQLEQLYLDLQLEGDIRSRLNIEEGITSSSSSGDDDTNQSKEKCIRRIRHHNKLVMIYEEDAPLPPPSPN